MDDPALLAEFVAHKSETAFQALVDRHSAMVYGVCLRGLGADAAEDATQAVFIILAQKAAQLRSVGSLSGWLYRTAQLTVAETRRQTQRRVQCEQRAASQAERTSVDHPQAAAEAEKDAAAIRAQLDAAIASLRTKQQDAVVLHYLQGKSLKESALALRCSEDTVKKRLQYAVEKLRQFFDRQGISLAAGLAAALQAEAQRTAPAGLARACASAGLKGLSVAKSGMIAKGAMKMMFWTNLKIAAVPAILALAIGIGSVAHVWSADKPVNHAEQPRDVTREEVKGPIAGPIAEPQEDLGWDPNPFDGTESITVVNGARTLKLEGKNWAKNFVADNIQVLCFDNNMGVLAEPSSTITFHRGARGDYSVGVTSDGLLMAPTGVISVDPKLWASLNKELTQLAGVPIDALQFVPVPVPGKKVRKELTVAAMKSGFKTARFDYELGKHPREILVTDPADIQALSNAFAIEKELKRSTDFRNVVSLWAEFTAETNDGPELKASFVEADELRTFINNIKIKPAFVNELNRIATKFEGRAIDILHDNPLAPQQSDQNEKLNKLLHSARSITILNDERGRAVKAVMDADAVTKSFAKLEFVATLPQPFKAVPAGLKLSVTPSEGQPFTITFMKNEGLTSRVILASPVEISGFGQAWLSDQWQYEFRMFLYDSEQKRKSERYAKTTARVLKDLPAFLKQVHNIQIGHANIPQETFSFPYNARNIGELLSLLNVEKMTEDHAAEVAKEQQKALLKLAPGYGYDLILQFVDERKAVVPGWGTIEFKNDVAAAIENHARASNQSREPQQTVKPPSNPENGDF